VQTERIPSRVSAGRERDPLWGLFLASFLFSLQDAGVLLALPWRIMSLGGGTVAVGAVGALSLGIYTISCLGVRSVAGRVGLKRLVIASTLVTAALLLLMPLAPRVWIVLSIIACKGVVMGAFWPQLMGWLSTGAEGGALNRRLSLFNLSWSAGSILGTWLGGKLFGVAYWLPFAIGACSSMLAAVSVWVLPAPKRPSQESPAAAIADLESPQLEVFRWIARLGLFSGYLGLGLLRVPIASLIKELNLGAGVHATIGAGMNVIMVVCFFLLGRWVIWHYKFWPVVLAQGALSLFLIGVGASQSSIQLMVLVWCCTPMLSFIYSSHLFYCVSGSRRRERNAAIHEILLAAGFAVGSFGGGILGWEFGIRSAYGIIGGLLAATLVLQSAMFIRYQWVRPVDRAPVSA
jgi:MFS family permease